MYCLPMVNLRVFLPMVTQQVFRANDETEHKYGQTAQPSVLSKLADKLVASGHVSGNETATAQVFLFTVPLSAPLETSEF